MPRRKRDEGEPFDAQDVREAMRKSRSLLIAHDMVHAILEGELPCPYNGHEKEVLVHYAECLCWMFGHGGTFTDDFNRRMTEIADYILETKFGTRLERHKVN